MSVCKQTPRKNVQLVNRPSENTTCMYLVGVFFPWDLGRLSFHLAGSCVSLTRSCHISTWKFLAVLFGLLWIFMEGFL